MYDAATSVSPPLRTTATGVSALLPLHVAGLSFKANGKTIIDQLDLNLSGGGITAIMGANGAGKSVLVRLLHGLLDPSAGSITWKGQKPDPIVRARQALVSQRPVLLRRSVSANLGFALALRPFSDRAKRLTDALEAAGLNHLAGQPARVLSGGEQQRLALARALALEPEVLFLDEPTASLDPASVLAIEELIITARKNGAKVVLITHDLGQARRLADDIVFLHHGKLSEHTSAAAFWRMPDSMPAQAYVEGRIFL